VIINFILPGGEEVTCLLPSPPRVDEFVELGKISEPPEANLTYRVKSVGWSVFTDSENKDGASATVELADA
jgi:hypothetical protein